MFSSFCVTGFRITASTCLDQRLLCISKDAVDSKDVGVGTHVAGGVDNRHFGRNRARHQVALMQTPVAGVDGQAQEVSVLLQLAATTQTLTTGVTNIIR